MPLAVRRCMRITGTPMPDDEQHGHPHVVTADQTGGGWREQLGVVLAVGLRPCSVAILWWVELLGALAVLGFGAVLLLASL